MDVPRGKITDGLQRRNTVKQKANYHEFKKEYSEKVTQLWGLFDIFHFLKGTSF